MKTIKIDSWKKANTSALVQAFLAVLFCAAYTYIVMIFTGGEEFVGKHPTQEVVNGIRQDAVLVICGMLAAWIPVISLRYTKFKFLFLYMPLSILYYSVIMLACVCTIGAYNPFDLINYATTSIPMGSLVGTAIAIIINQYQNGNK